MLSDEGMRSAACDMSRASSEMLRAANMISESVNTLQVLMGQGYGNNLEQLLEELKKLNNPIIKVDSK